MGAFQQRVIDVGDVLNIDDIVPGVSKGAVEEVKADVGCRMAEMSGVVGCDAADVHPRGVIRRQRHQGSVLSVIDRDCGPVYIQAWNL